ncbi:MAG: diguanylate cyclase [Candidatus Saccharibacteria bacterium]|nr:diguanylate cyclase [Moraxellaceae bacterium]
MVFSDQHEIEPDDNKVYKTLLESTKAIPWRIDWATMKFSYIGPQIEALLGWKPESWISVEDWAARMHEEDREKVVNFCVSQSKSGIDHEADYRALTADGNYVWIRDVVHVVRKNGEVDALVGFMFDISERKKTEDELLRLNRKLEEYSFTDGLTSVANRRLFDMTLEREWGSAYRECRPLSLIMFDIDYFKNYNDQYGHPAGDECLKRVAQLLSTVAGRSRDIFARFGGEEFVMLLPETDAHNAIAVAEKCRQIVLNEMIPHRSSKLGAYMTVSVGVSTIIPTVKDTANAFVERVDWLLYQAKQEGRNCVVSGGKQT